MSYQMKTSRTEIIYEIYDFLYREPQHIGKIKNPNSKYNDYDKVMNHLKLIEVTLNHMVNIFFTFLPSRFLHSFFEKSLNKPMWTDEYDVFVDSLENAIWFETLVTQPDVLFVWEKTNVAIEMKINANSSLDQLMKYALLFCMEEDKSKIEKSNNLIFLWKWEFKNLREEGYKDTKELKIAFSQYEISDRSSKWWIDLSNYHSRIKKMVKSMTISYISYKDMKDFCITSLEGVKNNYQLEKLFKWMILELDDRNLT